MKEMNAINLPYITDIQKYSIHNGPGIRSTVFFKGCPLKCMWCHNPETQSFDKELLFYEERCSTCGRCAAVCNSKASVIERVKNVPVVAIDRMRCRACGECVDECFNNARELCGKQMEGNMLVTELLKDRAFYETSGGGVTFSGGEVLAQNMDYVVPVMRRLKAFGINIAVDTCGAVPYERIKAVLSYTDLFLYDLKIMDSGIHEKYIGTDNAEILDNLRKLSQDGAKIWIRIPLIGGVNDSDENFRALADFLKDNDIRYEQINLLPYHNTGTSKYLRIGRRYSGTAFAVPPDGKMEEIRQFLGTKGIEPVISGG